MSSGEGVGSICGATKMNRQFLVVISAMVGGALVAQ